MSGKSSVRSNLQKKKSGLEDVQKSATSENFVSLRKETGMNRKEFAEWMGIPYRTMQDWELGISKAPDYVYNLAKYKVKNELEKGNLIRKQHLQKECR
ncbi:helix-turn-helix domain-containing protein [Butyrivibrio sp. JL13D10]|uniref:helix-turn-helix domain-containing protein n=1 Tax=Butyrivibrio sp. JL13D10 TaxID=3236815 RepID=UPI0038B5CAE5